MKSYGKYILAAIVALLVASSCGHRRARVIPEKTMAAIYAEMFLADSWLLDHDALRRKADTTQFFGAIFHRYGYTFEDYDKSVNHYLENPGKFAKIFEQSAKILEQKRDVLKEEEKRLDALRTQKSYLSRFAPVATDFDKDTILRIKSSEDVPLSLEIVRDTVAKDTVAKDTVLIQESIDIDNVERRDSIRTDSLPKARKFAGHQLVAD